MSSPVIKVYVTHVKREKSLLKLWGQLDQAEVLQVKKTMEQFAHILEQTPEPHPSVMSVGEECYVKRTDAWWYRARVASLWSAFVGVGSVPVITVYLLDYGNTEEIPLTSIRLIEDLKLKHYLQSFPPQATEFVLADVVPPGGEWSDPAFQVIRDRLCFEEMKGQIVGIVDNMKFIRLFTPQKDELFVNLIIQCGMAVPPGNTATMPPSLGFGLSSEMEAKASGSTFNERELQTLQVLPSEKKHFPVAGHLEAERPINQMEDRSVQRKQFHQPAVEEQYISSALPPNTEHVAYVSAVETGPAKFALQLESYEETLKKLMDEINSLESYEQMIAPGNALPCLAKFSEDAQFYRAIITKVNKTECKVYYVDYGNSNLVPKSDLYVIPKRFMQQKILSIRCSLSGLKSEMVMDKELAKATFQGLVDDKRLICKVLPRPKDSDSKSTQIVELYDGGNSILHLLAQKGVIRFPSHLKRQRLQFIYVSVEPGLCDFVVVTFVERVLDFFIQLDRNIEALEELMEKVCTAQEKQNEPINPSDVYVGMPCCAKYSEDDQWYRSEILELPSDGQVHVKFVDYGNSQFVPLTELKSLNPEYVDMLYAQSIRCSLDGFEGQKPSEDVNEHFQELVIDKSLVCKIKHVKKGIAVVDLFDSDNIHINSVLLKMSQRSELQHVTGRRLYMVPQPKVDEIEQLHITHIESASYMYGQLKKFDVSKLLSYQKRLAILCKTHGILLYSDGLTHISENCAVPSQDDYIFYRAKIVGEEDDHVFVRHIDIGSNIIPLKRTTVYRLEDEFLKLPEYGISVSIADIPPHLTRETLWHILVDCVEVKVVEKQDDKYIVKLTASELNQDTIEKLHSEIQTSTRSYRDSSRSNRVPSGSLQLTNHNRSLLPAERMSRGPQKDETRFTNDPRLGNSDGRKEHRGHLKSGSSRSIGNWQRHDRELNGDHVSSEEEEAVGRANCRKKKPVFKMNNQNSGGNPLDKRPRSWGMNQNQGAAAPPRFSESGADVNGSKGESFPKLEIDVGYIKDVDVVFVVSPDEFYMQLKEHSAKLQNVMAKTNQLYCDNDKSFSPNTVSKGMLCVAKFSIDDVWYRGQVVGVWGNTADVYFVDYGNIERMNASRIRTIECSLTELPAQAVKCALYNTKPKGSTWTKADVEKFDALTMNKSLIATFVSQRADDTFLINIVDASKMERISTVNKAFQVGTSSKPGASESQTRNSSVLRGRTDKVQKEKWPDDTWETFTKPVNKAVFTNSGQQFKENHHIRKRSVEKNKPRGSDSEELDKSFGEGKKKPREVAGISQNQRQRGSDSFRSEKKINSLEREPVQPSKRNSHEVRLPAELPRPKTRYKELKVPVGKQENVSICWIFNPEDFYCQLSSSENEFLQLMSNIQKFYDSVSENDYRETNISPGTPLIVNYVKDSVWYRAEVRRLAGPKVEVLYVDYGNIDLVMKNNIKRVKAEFMELPKQAVRCSLKGIHSHGNLHWSNWNDDVLNRYFGEETYQCEFFEKEGDCYLVDLNEMQVAKMMIQEKIADGATPSGVGSTVHTTFPKPKVNVSCGEQVSVFVSHIETALKFWVQLVDTDEANEVLEKVETYCTHMKDAAGVPCHVGTACLARYTLDEAWYRAVIKEKLSTTEIKVFFVDFGNTDIVSPEELKPISEDLLQLTPQAIECSLTGATTAASRELLEKFKAVAADCVLTVKIDKIEGSTIMVTMFDDEGKNVNETLGCTKPPVMVSDKSPVAGVTVPSFTIQEGEVTVYVSHVESPNHFWIQHASDIEALGLLSDELLDFYDTQGKGAQLTNVIVGEICVAKYSEDSAWYRAKILEVTDDTLKVRFIDYGNTDNVQAIEIMVLDKKFASTPQMALESSLRVEPFDKKNWSQKAIDRLMEFSGHGDEELLATVIPSNNKFYVDLRNNSEDASKTLVNENFASEISHLPVRLCNLPHLEISQGELVELYVSYFENPSKFCIQLVSMSTILDSLMELINVEDEEPLPEYVPVVGSLCLARYSEDNQFYRALVKVVHVETVLVKFIDYGNEEEISRTEVKFMKEEFSKTASLAIDCRLATYPKESEWTGAAILRFQEVIGDGEKMLKGTLKSDENEYLVELFDGNTDIIQVLVSEDYAVTQKSKTVEGTEKSVTGDVAVFENQLDIPFGIKINVLVSFVSSPTMFWLQLKNNNSKLAQLMDDIAKYYNETEDLQQLSEHYIGQLCIGQSSLDEVWYRAVVHAVNEDTVFLQYVDYGRSEVVSRNVIREIEKRFADLPYMAIEVTMQLKPAVGENWSEEAIARFREHVEGKELLMAIITKEEENLVAKLYDGDTDLTLSLYEAGITHLKEESEVSSIAVEIPSLKVPVEERIEVIVSHIESPVQFWVQLSNYISHLDELMDSMAEFYFSSTEEYLLQDVHIGQICMALYPADSGWYRARIIDIQAEKVKVLYIDYGNCEEVDMSLLRVLDSKFAQLPVMSVEVSLPLIPFAGEEWTETAVRTFQEITEGVDTLAVSLTRQGEKYMAEICDEVDIVALMVRAGLAKIKGEKCQIPPESGKEPEIEPELGKDSETEPKTEELEIESESEEHEEYVSEEETEDYESGEDLEESDRGEEAEESESGKELEVGSESGKELEVESEGGKELEVEPSSRREPSNTTTFQTLLTGESPTAVIVSHIVSPSQFWIQASNQLNFLDFLQEQVKTGLGTVVPNPVCGNIYAVNCSDGAWYRAQVLTVQDDKIRVLLIDYGNEDTLNIDYLKIIPEGLANIRAMSMECSLGLTPVDEEWTEEAVSMFQSLVEQEEKKLTARLLHQGDVAVVDLRDSEINISQVLVEAGFANQVIQYDTGADLCLSGTNTFKDTEIEKEKDWTPEITEFCCPGLPSLQIPTGVQLDVTISHCLSPSDLYLQLHEKGSDLDKMMVEMKEYYASENTAVEVVDVVEEGSVCVTQFSGDGGWYRGKVIAIVDEKIHVCFIDYGSLEQVEKNAIRKLHDRFMNVPPMAVPCYLKVIPIDGDDWNDAALDAFERITVNSAEILQAVFKPTQGKYEVELKTDWENLAEILVQMGLAKKKEVFELDTVDTCPDILIREDNRETHTEEETIKEITEEQAVGFDDEISEMRKMSIPVQNSTLEEELEMKEDENVVLDQADSEQDKEAEDEIAYFNSERGFDSTVELSPCQVAFSVQEDGEASSTNISSTTQEVGVPGQISAVKLDDLDSSYKEENLEQTEICKSSNTSQKHEETLTQTFPSGSKTEADMVVGFVAQEKCIEFLKQDNFIASNKHEKNVHSENSLSPVDILEKFGDSSGGIVLQHSEENEKPRSSLLNSTKQFELFLTAQEQLSVKLDAVIEEPEPESDSVTENDMALPFDPFVTAYGPQLTGKLATVEEMTEEEANFCIEETKPDMAFPKDKPLEEENEETMKELRTEEDSVTKFDDSTEEEPAIKTELLSGIAPDCLLEENSVFAEETDDDMFHTALSELQDCFKTDLLQPKNEGACADFPVLSKNAARIKFLEISEKEEIEVCVISCNNISEFSCLLCSSAIERKILENNLENFIAERTRRSKTEGNLEDLSIGSQCVLQVDSQGYRVVIIGEEMHEQKEKCVFLLDTGKKQYVSTSQLHPLPELLCSIPAQAVMCKLSHVTPKVGVFWDAEACARFEELTHQKEMKMLLKSISSYEESRTPLYLPRIHEVEVWVEGKNIADILTDEGYAKKLTSL